MLEMLPRIVPLEDEEISAELEKAFRKRASRFHPGQGREGHERRERRYGGLSRQGRPSRKRRRRARADGRGPRAEDGESGPREDPRQARTRIRARRTASWKPTSRGVYAIGDIVAGMPQLAHAASMEGIIAVGKMTGKACRPLERRRIPNCHLLRAANRLDRPDRTASARSGLRGEDRQVSVPGQQQGHDPRVTTKASSKSSPTRRTAKFWACTSSARWRRK